MLETIVEWGKFWARCFTEGKSIVEAPSTTIAAFSATVGAIWLWWRRKKSEGEWRDVILKRWLPKTMIAIGTFYVFGIAPFREFKTQELAANCAATNSLAFANRAELAQGDAETWKKMVVSNAAAVIHGLRSAPSLQELRMQSVALCADLRALNAEFFRNYQSIPELPIETLHERMESYYGNTIFNYTLKCAVRVEMLINNLAALGIDTKDLESLRPDKMHVSFRDLAETIERKLKQ